MTHGNAPLSVEGRRRLVARCADRPIAHVAAEMGISRACASKWVNRFRRFGDLGLLDRSCVPHRQPTATPAEVVAEIEAMRRTRKWSASRITFELERRGITISRRTVSRHLVALGLNRRRFIDPTGESNRVPRPIVARRPGHMVHVDVKKVSRIPDGGGWRVHGKGSAQAKAVASATKAGVRAGYVYLHSAVDGFSRLAYTEALDDEKAITAIGFMHRARVWFAAHGITHIQRIVTDNGSCYRAKDFAHVLHGARHQFITPYTPRHNGKVERYNRILAEEPNADYLGVIQLINDDAPSPVGYIFMRRPLQPPSILRGEFILLDVQPEYANTVLTVLRIGDPLQLNYYELESKDIRSAWLAHPDAT